MNTYDRDNTGITAQQATLPQSICMDRGRRLCPAALFDEHLRRAPELSGAAACESIVGRTGTDGDNRPASSGDDPGGEYDWNCLYCRKSARDALRGDLGNVRYADFNPHANNHTSPITMRD